MARPAVCTSSRSTRCRRTSALRTRAFLRQFIETYFGPNDTAAVVLTTGGLRESGQEFTGNPRLLLKPSTSSTAVRP